MDCMRESDICSLKSFEQMCIKYDSLSTHTELSNVSASKSTEFVLRQNTKSDDNSWCPESIVDEANFLLVGCKLKKQSNWILNKESNRYKQKTIQVLSFKKNFDCRAQHFRHRRRKINHKQQRRMMSNCYRPVKSACLSMYSNTNDLFEKDMDDLVTNLKLLSLNDHVNGAFCEEDEFKATQSYDKVLDCRRNAVADSKCLSEKAVLTVCTFDKPLDQKTHKVNSKEVIDSISISTIEEITNENVFQSSQIYDELTASPVICPVSYGLGGNIKDKKANNGGSSFINEHVISDSDNEMNIIKWNYFADKEAGNDMLEANGDECSVVPIEFQLQTLSSPCKSFFISPSEVDSSEESDCDSHCLDEEGWTSNDEVTTDLSYDDFCASFKWNRIYFPNELSSGQDDFDLKDSGCSFRIYPLSVDHVTDTVCLSSSKSAESYNEEDDDVVFSDDHDNLPTEPEEEEKTLVCKLSRIEIINCKWNQAYSYTGNGAEKNGDIECKKAVHFAPSCALVTTHSELTSEAEAYAAARKGPWEEYARDRDRFTRRIRETEEQISWVLSPNHRKKVSSTLFSGLVF